MYALTPLFFALPFALALALSWHPALGTYRRSMLNPILLVALFILLTAADYLSMELAGYGVLARHRVFAASEKLAELQVKTAVMYLVALAGIGLAFQMPRAAPKPGPKSVPVGRFAILLYLAVLALWLALLLVYAGGSLSLAGSTELKFATAWDSNLYMLSMLLLPGLCYLLPRQSWGIVIPIVVLSVLLTILSGSRTKLLFVLIPLAFFIVRVKRINLPRSFFVGGTVVLGLAMIAAVNYRQLTNFNKDVTVSTVLNTSNLFNGVDFAYAETGVALSGIRQLQDYPGQDMVGFVFAGVPRSVVPFKPYKGSDRFTMIYDPFIWNRDKRNLVIGGTYELMFDYPFPIALLMAGLFGFAWGWGFLRSTRSKTIHGFAWTVAMYAMLYTYLRTDIQTIGQVIWVFGIYMLAIKGYQGLRARSGAGAKGPVPRPPEYRRPAPALR